MERIRTWRSPCGRFALKLYDTQTGCGFGRSRLAYKFYAAVGDNPNCERELIFKGDDFSPSPDRAIDSDAAVGQLLFWFSLRPGDTDSDYFKKYTRKQMDFARTYGEELGVYARELEEGVSYGD